MRTRRIPAPHTPRSRTARMRRAVAAALALPLALGTLAATALPAAAGPSYPTMSGAPASAQVDETINVVFTCPNVGDVDFNKIHWLTSGGSGAGHHLGTVVGEEKQYHENFSFPIAGEQYVDARCVTQTNNVETVVSESRFYFDIKAATPAEVATDTLLLLDQPTVAANTESIAYMAVKTTDGNDVTTGSFQVSIDGTSIPVSALDHQGGAQATLPGLPAGTYDVRASYQGAVGYLPSHTSATLTVETQAPVVADTTTTLSLSQSTVEPGQGLYAETITTTANGTATDGSVQFSLDGQPSGPPVPVDSLGRAGALYKPLVAGNRTVTATYLGSSLFKPSSSEAKSAFAKSKATILPSIPSSTQAPYTTLRASFASVPGFPVPTGTVTFRYSEGAPLGTATIVDGLATLDLPGLAAGDYDVFVDYSGDNNFGSSTSARTTMAVAPAVPQVPHKSPSEVTVDVPAKVTGPRVEVKVSVTPGQQWAVMSTVESAGPTGSVAVTLTKGGERQEVELVDGVATAVFDGVAPDDYEVEAFYRGDKNFDVSVGSAKTTVVAPPVVTPPVVTPPVVTPPVVTPPVVAPPVAPAPDLSGSTSTLPAGGKITLVAREFLPFETVSFYLHSDPVFLGTAVADADGVATLVVAIPAGAPAGAHHVRATGQTSQRTAEIPVTVTAAAPVATGPIVTVPVETPVETPAPAAPAASAAAAPAPAAATAAPVVVAAAPLAATGAELGSTALLVSVLLGSGALLLAGRRRLTTSAR